MRSFLAALSIITVNSMALNAAYYSCPANQYADQYQSGYYNQGQGHWNQNRNNQDNAYSDRNNQSWWSRDNRDNNANNNSWFGNNNDNRSANRDNSWFGSSDNRPANRDNSWFGSNNDNRSANKDNSWFGNSDNSNRSTSNDNSWFGSWGSDSAKDGYKSENDRTILNNVRAALKNRNDINSRNVTVYVYDRVVKLNGNVDNNNDSAVIEEVVGRVNGVSDVENNLKANNSNNNINSGYFSRGNNTSSNNSPDYVILEKIQGEIERNGTADKFSNVEIQVVGGRVVLNGTIDTEQARKNLKERLQNIREIRDVQDNLQVRNTSDKPLAWNDKQPPSNVVVADDTLKSQINKELKGGFWNKAYDNLEITVNDGHVTIKGTVEKNEDVKDIMERLAKIEGIKSVDNQVVVRQVAK